MRLWASAALAGIAIILMGWANCLAVPLPLTPAQALSFRRIADLRFSPDGSKLAFVVLSYRWDWLPHIDIVDVAKGALHEITPSGKSERSPQWSADGETLAFLSNRNGKSQVFAMPAGGGNALPLTQRKYGVEAFHWSPDGRAIAYLAKDDAAPGEGAGPQLADDERRLSRLWLLDLASKTTRKLAKTGYRIDEFQWQDRSHILAVATAQPRIEEFTEAIYRVSIDDGSFALAARPPQPFDSLSVAPDGKRFALRSTAAGGPIPRSLFLGTAGESDLHPVSLSANLAVAEMKWSAPPAIWLRLIDGFMFRISRYAPDGTAISVNLPLSVDSFDVSRDGRLAFAGGDFGHLPEIYLRNNDGSLRQLTHLQQGWNNSSLAPTTVFKTRSFDGTPIEAALMKPRAARAGEKLPLVLLVHGGPSANFTAGYRWETAWAQMLASHGYEVLMVNPRGSNGYSEDFLKANRGDWGGGDFRDLMAVLDAVIAKGETDPNRLGIGGWSYGGEMTTWAITQTNRFRAAVAGAGVFDQQAEFETESDPAGDEWYFGTPWEHPEIFARNSPATFIRKAHTPTLIFDGEDDENNPVGQSKGLYRALKHFGVETQMVLYPGEGHSPRNGAYNIDMFARILAWYDSHLRMDRFPK